MSDTPPRKSRSKRRNPPRKRAWYEHPWLLPGLGLACLFMALIVAVAWWRQHSTDANPIRQAQSANEDLQDSIHQVYNGDYTLLDPNLLNTQERLPRGLQMRKDANELVSPWGRVELMGANALGQTQGPYTHYLVIYYTIPQKDCAQLATQMLARYGQVWVGQSPPLTNPKEKVGNASEIASRCQAASSSVMALGQ